MTPVVIQRAGGKPRRTVEPAIGPQTGGLSVSTFVWTLMLGVTAGSLAFGTFKSAPVVERPAFAQSGTGSRMASALARSCPVLSAEAGSIPSGSAGDAALKAIFAQARAISRDPARSADCRMPDPRDMRD